MSFKPVTPSPTDTEWENHARWAVGPVGTRRQLWVEKEAQVIHQERTGRADPFPSMDDYMNANLRISRFERDAVEEPDAESTPTEKG